MRKLAMTVLITLMMVLPIASMGATIVHTDSVDGLTDLFATLTVPQFDGTYPLNSITIEANTWLDGAISFENMNTAATGGFNVTGNWFDGWLVLGGELNPGNWEIIGGETLFEYHDEGDPSGAIWLETYDGVLDYAGPSGTVFPYGTSHDDWTMTITPDSPLFADFIGTGNVDFSCMTWIWTDMSIFGPVYSMEWNTTAGYGITVTYDFDSAVATEESSFGSVKALFR